MTLKNKIRLSTTLASIIFCVGCLPRGETKTLQDVFDRAKEQYNSVEKSAIAPQIQQQLANLTKHLDEISAGAQSGAFSEHAQNVADILADLTNHAGYPSRPALGELAARYRELSSNSGSANFVASPPPQVKLLMARTYSLLSSELSVAKFRIQ